MTEQNDHLVLICGPSSTGKSASLMNIDNPEGVMYLNTEANKKLPFKSRFLEYNITDPLDIPRAIQKAEEMPDIHTIIVDSLTFLMDQYESVYVLNSPNTMKAWGEFQQFFKQLMQQDVAKSTKNIIFTAHTSMVLNENEAVMETKVPVKGALKNNGVESYFSTVVSTKRVPMKELSNYKSDLLHISPEEEALGFKYCFQTKITKKTIHERIRSPMGMFSEQETFMDNDAQLLINRLHEYYA
jgi:archaellum biogenesis ATPase FlaH